MRIHRPIHLLPLQLTAEQIVVHVGLGASAAGCFDVPPGSLLGRSATSFGSLAHLAILGPQLLHIPIGKRQLFLLQLQLLFEHGGAFPVPRGELLRHQHGVRIGYLRGQPTAAFSVVQLPALRPQGYLGRRERITHGRQRHLHFEERGVELRGTGLGVARRGMVGKELLEPGPKPFKHGGIVRVTESPNGTDRPGGRQPSADVTFLDMPKRLLLLSLVAFTAGCGGERRGGACGLTAIAGATMLLQEFGTPNQTLGEPPTTLPPHLVARVAAGPAFPAVVGRTSDSGWVIGVDGTVPATIKPGFGVLVLDTAGKARGVMIFESEPIRGAPIIGKLSLDTLMLPLIGIQLDPARFEDPRCPVFPDSLLQ